MNFITDPVINSKEETSKVKLPVKKEKISKSVYSTNSMYSLGGSLYENFYNFLAISLGSAGILQGLLTSVRQLGSALLNPLTGRLADYFGRRRFLFLGNFLLGLLSLIVPLAPNAFVMLIFIIIHTLLNTIVIPAWVGYLGDITQANVRKRGEIIGRIGMVATYISHGSILFIAIFMDSLNLPRESISVLSIPFIIASFSYFASAFFALKIPVIEYKKPTKLVPKLNIRELEINPYFKRFIIIEGIFMIAWSSAWPIFPYVTLDVTNTWTDIGLLAIVFAIFFAPSQRIGGKLVDKFGKKRVIQLSRIFIIIPPILFVVAALTNDPLYIYFVNISVGLGLGAGIIATNTFLLDVAPEEYRSTYQSIYAMVVGLAGFFGSTLTGALLEIMIGNVRPTTDILVLLLGYVFVIRLIAWFSYQFLKEPPPNENISI